MSRRSPDLDSMIDGLVSGPGRGRLLRVHEALVRAGPLPVLPHTLSRPPAVGRRRLPAARRARSHRRALPIAAAAAFALAAGAAAYALSVHSGEAPQRVVALRATAAAPAARASMRIGRRDAAGNWVLTLRVSGLPALKDGGYYEMYLTRNGRVATACGTFKTHAGSTVVRFNVPFRLRPSSGWIVRPEQPHGAPGPALLTT